MKKRNLVYFILLSLAGILVIPSQWACTKGNKLVIPIPTFTIPAPNMAPAGVPVPMNYIPPASGLFVVGAFVDFVYDTGSGPSSPNVITLVTLSLNQQGVPNAGVTLTPAGGTPVPCNYLATYNLGTYSLSQYEATSYAYTSNLTYTLNVATTGGNASANLAAPGGISFADSGVTVTASATYPGNYDAGAVATANTPSGPTTTYVSTVGTSIPPPFTFPASAYVSTPSSPATFSTNYCVSNSTTSVTGGTGGLVGVQMYSQTANR